MSVAELSAARQVLRGANKIAVLTGAGMSAESGIPTFRSAGGFWQGNRAEDLATPEGFARDPKMVWEWYDWRRATIANSEPNPGHHALAEVQRRSTHFTLTTQNVDGLHERAGSTNVLRLHGSIWTIRCLQCSREVEDFRRSLPELPPCCEVCGGMMRPGVVWFGESLPEGVFERACSAVMDCDLFLVVGTSAVVYPAASLVPLARRSDATVIEVNPDETDVSGIADHVLRGPSGEILPELLSS